GGGVGAGAGEGAGAGAGLGGGALATVTVAEPVFNSLVAVMVAEPAATANTAPVGPTVATASLLVVHCTLRSVRITPSASRSVAIAVVELPVVRLAEPSATFTDATAGNTVSDALPVTPSLVAVTRTAPLATPRINPPDVTVATPSSLDVHDTA